MPVLDPDQVSGVQWILKGLTKYKGVILADIMGKGKAQPYNTPVLTPDGWREIGSIETGDTVFSSNGKTCVVTGVYPQGMKDIYRVTFSDYTYTECCKEHLWKYRSDNHKNRKQGWQVAPLEYIEKLKARCQIPVVQPVDHTQKKYIIEPYTLGALIGDGYLCGPSISISTPDTDIITRIIEESKHLCTPGSIYHHENHKRYNLNGLKYKQNDLLNEIRRLKLNVLSLEKFIPPEYFLGSVEQRTDLLKGLMDTDGCCSVKENGSCSCIYSTSSPELAYDIKQLVLSLGGRALIKLRREKEYTINVLLDFNPFYCYRKAAKWVKPKRFKPVKYFKNIEYIGEKEAVCISVHSDDSTYITNDYIVTHNTAQSLEVLKKALKTKKPGLIIVPAYLIYNWCDELDFWNIKGERCIIDSTKQVLYDADIYIVSYDMAVSDLIFKQLFKKEFSLVICDEAHYLKSWNSRRSRRILGTYQNKKSHYSNRTNKMLLLTGTPLLNRIEELYHIIIRIAPESLNHMSKYEFLNCYAAKIYHTPYGIKHEGVKKEAELRLLLKQCMLSRKFIEGLPPRENIQIPIVAKDAKTKKAIQDELDFIEDNNMSVDDLEGLDNLQSVEAFRYAELRQKTAVFKLTHLTEPLKDTLTEHGSCIIYVYHKSVIEAVEVLLQKKFKAYTYEVITGNVTKKKRHNIVKDFQESKFDIIIATIGALKEGHNITRTNVVHYIEMDWTPAAMEQTARRVLRKGQTRQMYCYYYYFTTGIDELMRRRLKEKSEMIKKII